MRWKKLEIQRKIQKAIVVYKSLHGLAPGYLRFIFTDRCSTIYYTLRDTENKLAIPKRRTNYLKNGFSYSGAVLWNSFPVGLRRANTLSKFRAGCSDFFN